MIPLGVTHVLIANGLNFVRARAFYEHPNIQEVICHDGVEKIEREAFYNCPSLRWIIMPGVKVVKTDAFTFCSTLTYIECGKLERIGAAAFRGCTSLSSIDLPSIKIVEAGAFSNCTNLINAKFGKDLESIRGRAFHLCPSLERIALPLKDGVMADDESIFQWCKKLKHVDLVGEVHENAAALLLEHWKNDMNEEIDSINQILPNTSAGGYRDAGRKTLTIRRWITSVHRKYTYYEAKHRRYLNVSAAKLQPALPNDILFKNVLPFVELPSDTFGGEELLAREEQEKEMLAARMLQLPCQHADPDCLELDRTVIQFVHAFGMEFDEAVEYGDKPNPQHFLIAAKNATMDEFAAVWKDFAMMDMAISFHLCKGTQDILEGDCLDARKSAIIVRYFEQHIAVELLQERALIKWLKIGELYVADDHTLVKFYRNHIPCSCLDEKYQEVKHITKLGFCWNPGCRIPGRSVERSKTKYCSRCRRITYCSRECKETDRWRHKPICDKNLAMIAEFEARQERVRPAFDEEKLPCLEEQPKEIVVKNVRYKSEQCQFLSYSYLPSNICSKCVFQHGGK